ncbi:MAG: hypothetical protein BRC24_00255 [Parcubacteria group bacterium SW_4_46_8]|nr:MAG: hypothetical protein BRC24_00255 [Parcubacteria group bacterium SW_4_46_8]
MIVHKTLAGDSCITTESTGHGENRRVVVYTKEKRDVGIKVLANVKSVGMFQNVYPRDLCIRRIYLPTEPFSACTE